VRLVCVRLGALGRARPPATLLAGQCRGPSRQNFLSSCSTGKHAAISDGACMGSIGVWVALEVKAPPRPPMGDRLFRLRMVQA
jgi:hypothetical protein